MMNRIIFILLLFVMVACKDKPTYVQLKTTKGDIVLRLYDETPLHKENFIKLVEEGYYDSLLFHRVIDEFMIQGGDPNSKNAPKGTLLGNGGPEYLVPAEFNDSLFHKKGVLAAARGDHPEKASNAAQFYIVEGKTWKDEDLDRFEDRYNRQNKENQLEFTELQRQTYKTIGGTPFLDQNYTVFGEVVAGMNVVDSISNVRTDNNDRPLEDVRVIEAEVIRYKTKKDKS